MEEILLVILVQIAVDVFTINSWNLNWKNGTRIEFWKMNYMLMNLQKILGSQVFASQQKGFREKLSLKTEKLSVKTENWAYLVTEFAKNVPCEIDKKELAEIAKRPCSKENGKQVHEIVKKHFPEIAAAIMKS
ncbi:hypothetical protein R3W88_028447 [Solanum pinnatisectum]|uniref:Uncharacterized protein n=1 Tax=Solanum pinnatisectum TaxID=50273 RepID=A0AAV9K2R1_9SOLN|nr:hypothetical protein R3W88_028447 [Solanum pinnatisectum]